MQRNDSKAKKNPFHTIVRAINSLKERKMRAAALAQQLKGMPPEGMVEFLLETKKRAEKREVGSMLVLEAFHDLWLSNPRDPDLYELCTEAYRIAKDAQQKSVVHLLLLAQPQRGPIEPKDMPEDREVAKLTLGERKFFARGKDRARLEHLLRDSDQTVIAHLLKNPQFTEDDIVRLAARRPTRMQIQEEIYHSRWFNRYRVKLALAQNPYTSTELSLKLLIFFLGKHLRAIKDNASLHPLVRAEAKRLLEQQKDPQA